MVVSQGAHRGQRRPAVPGLAEACMPHAGRASMLRQPGLTPHSCSVSPRHSPHQLVEIQDTVKAPEAVGEKKAGSERGQA